MKRILLYNINTCKNYLQNHLELANPTLYHWERMCKKSILTRHRIFCDKTNRESRNLSKGRKLVLVLDRYLLNQLIRIFWSRCSDHSSTHKVHIKSYENPRKGYCCLGQDRNLGRNKADAKHFPVQTSLLWICPMYVHIFDRKIKVGLDINHLIFTTMRKTHKTESFFVDSLGNLTIYVFRTTTILYTLYLHYFSSCVNIPKINWYNFYRHQTELSVPDDIRHFCQFYNVV